MSGFEIAGIVLGAFPLAISALEGYREMATKKKLFLDFAVEYEKSKIELNFIRVHFMSIMRKLLLPLAISETEINLLLYDPGNELWRQPRIAEMLETRLLDSCPLYLDITRNMQHTMGQVHRVLATHKDFEPVIDQNETQDSRHDTKISKRWSPFSKDNREYLRYRLKYSFEESTRKQLFEKLHHFNNQLDRLLEISDIESNLREQRKAFTENITESGTESAICTFWHFASQFYQALLKAWKCNCSEQHYAHFLLQHRISDTKDFHVVLLQLSSSERGQWPSRKLKVEVKNKPGVKPLSLSNNNAMISAINTHELNKSDLPKGLYIGQGKHNPAISSTVMHQENGHPSMVRGYGPTNDCLSADTAESEKRPIESLCEIMAEETDLQCAGYFQDTERRYYLYPNHKSSNNYSPSPITLNDLLSGNIGQVPRRRQRCSLALILASSFLQLYGSPWMAVPWGKSSIYFPRELETSDSILLNHVSLARGFSGSPNNTDTSGLSNEIQGLDSLAILLLELCFGHPIEEHKIRKRMTVSDAKTRAALDLVVAWKWHTEVNNEAGDGYAGAVKWCLNHHKTPPSGDWRKEMVLNVLAPLEKCCNSFESD